MQHGNKTESLETGVNQGDQGGSAGPSLRLPSPHSAAQASLSTARRPRTCPAALRGSGEGVRREPTTAQKQRNMNNKKSAMFTYGSRFHQYRHIHQQKAALRAEEAREPRVSPAVGSAKCPDMETADTKRTAPTHRGCQTRRN